jgi:RNA polymerase sigma-70 factor (ECF subfamily)
VAELSSHSDEELLEALYKGSKDAFQEIFDRYWYRLYKMAYIRIKSHEEAEEIVQDLFLTLWHKRNTLSIAHLPSYLLVATRRRVISHIRSQITQEKYWEYYQQFVPGHTKTTEETVAYNELHHAIENVISRLPQKSQQVFRLNRLEGRSVAEIAESMKMPRRTIEYHLTKSLKALRIYLKDYILTLIIVFLFS